MAGTRTPRGTLALSLAAAVAVLASVALAIIPVWATDTRESGCTTEVEPNETPDRAIATAGSVCLAGELPAGDQDLFLWEVGRDGGSELWSMSVQGVPGARTIVELRPVLSDPGVIPLEVGGPSLVESVEPEQAGPLLREDLLLGAGRYLVGISAGGQTDAPGSPLAYTVTLSSSGTLPTPGDLEPNDDPAAGTQVTGEFTTSGDLQGSPDTYRWTLPVDGAATWSLRVITPLASTSQLNLLSADGASVLARSQSVDGLAELPDLALSSTEYVVQLDPAASEPFPYVLAAAASAEPTGDPEPNDAVDQAVSLPVEAPVARGRLARPQDEDWYRLDVTEALAGAPLDIRLVWPPGPTREVCLSASDGRTLLCRASSEGLNLAGLSLPVGSVHLRVHGEARPDEPYLLRIDPAGVARPDFEREPNDDASLATALPPGIAMRGRAVGADSDLYRAAIADVPQLWQVDVRGAGLRALDWVRPNGERLAGAPASDDGTTATLTDLYLVPGEHWLRVEATDGDYTIQLTPLGPPDPAAEREPNDLPAREEVLVVGRPRLGRLPTTTDTDVYRFALQGTDHVRLRVDPPADGELEILIQDALSLSQRLRAGPGSALRHDMLLGPGQYSVVLVPLVPSDERYAIELERLDPFVIADDQEPNNGPRSARPLPASGRLSGRADGTSDIDWFVLPASVDGAPVTLTVTGAVTALALDDGTGERPLQRDGGDGTWRSGPVPPGRPLLLRVAPTGAYDLELSGIADDAGTVAHPAIEQPTVSLALELEADIVTAWWPTGQRLAGRAHLVNPGAADVLIALDALVSDRRWRILLPDEPVQLAAGAEREVPFEALLPPDIPGDAPVRLTLGATPALVSGAASDLSGAAVTAHVDVQATVDAQPVAPLRVWSLPDQLLGGLDAANPAIGATIIPSLDATAEERLHDGVAAADWGLSWPIGSLPVTLTVDLAGDSDVPVAGVILHPLGEDPSLGDAARTFELALSSDGAAWETVLEGTLQPVAEEQAFVLPTPRGARYAQLRVTSLQRELASRLDLGEWNVVATPGWSPPGAPLDLADPRVGGHVAWLRPQVDQAAQQRSIIDEDPTAQTITLEPRTSLAWAIGFAQDRAALISSIEWHDPVPSDQTVRLAAVDVAVSTEGPLGPWRTLGRWRLDRRADGTVESFVPEAPVPARFVRFETTTGRRQERVELPGRIRILEAPQSEDYRSVLGQWGMGERSGPLEWRAAPDAPLLDDEGSPGDDVSRPRPLAEGALVSGLVHADEDEDWFEIHVPEGRHSLQLTITAADSVGAALRLHASDGQAVPMTWAPGEPSGAVVYSAEVQPGATYVVEVLQPPSSVVVAFDTSASVVTQLAAIEAGIRSLADGMTEDREALRVVPFDDQPLLPHWSRDRYEVADAVNRYTLGPSSSGVEANLEHAILDLAVREGGRAVLLLTDAASSTFHRSERLWTALAAFRPRVFPVAVGGEAELPAIERHHLMADWAIATGGVSSSAPNGTAVQAAFERLAAWLRRPPAYSLTYRTSPEKPAPPAPGSIGVVAATSEGRPSTLGRSVAVELVVDTSGSMRKRLGGRTRIELAREVLAQLVQDHLPAGVPVALRHFPPRSDPCGSDLLVPLAPLDPQALLTTIGRLDAPRDARTPLAEAIAAAASDLADVVGRRLIVVVSDGKESCKGDPLAEVERLRADGVDVTLNIVGLALDRASRRDIARLAEAGGGAYFDAEDGKALGDALLAALGAPVEIRDADGTVVGRSTVGGEPIELPPGTYDLVVLDEPAVTFSDVYVEPGADVLLALPVSDG